MPFSSARKWSGATFTGHGTWLLGAPGVLSRGLPAEVAASIARHEAEGQRVLLLAAASGQLDGERVPAARPLERTKSVEAKSVPLPA